MASAPTVVIVDGYSAGDLLPVAFGRLGIQAVHLRSSAELMRRLRPPVAEHYVDNLVWPGGPGGDDGAVAMVAAYRPIAVVAGAEAGVPLADRLSERLGLPSNGSAGSVARRDKYRMIETVRAAGLRCARQHRGADPDELAAWADREGYPVVVKPLTSGSTDHVTICHRADEVAAAARAVLAAPTIFEESNTEALVQSYLAGPEFIVDTVSARGQSYVCGVWQYDKQTIDGKRIYDRNVLLDPAEAPVPELIAYTRAVLAALGIEHGPAHAEVILTPQGPALVEIGARLDGNTDAAFQDACVGANQADLTALAYARPDAFVARYGGRVYAKLLHAVVHHTATRQEGLVAAVDARAVARIRALPSVRSVSVRLAAGDRIRPTVDLLSSPIQVNLAAADPRQLDADHRAVGRLKDDVFEVAGSPTLLLVGGASPLSSSRDIVTDALTQARSRGIRAHILNTAANVAATGAVNALAAEVSTVDPNAPEACSDWLAGRRFDLVLGLRDGVLPAVAACTERLGAPGNGPELVALVRNKDDCRLALAAAGFAQPAVRRCTSAEEAAAFLAASDGPWVVKPRDGMGSEGVTKVTGPADLPAALAGLPDPGLFLVEEFVDGPECSVEGVVLRDGPRVLAVTEKTTLPPPHFVELGHVMPAPLAPSVQAAVEREVTGALVALGVRPCVFHVELWLTAKGVVLGEVHVRPGGDWLHRLLTYSIPGLELFGLLYDDYLGRPAPRDLTPTRGAAARFLAPPPGRLLRVEGWSAVASHPAVLFADLTVAPGDEIAPIRESGDRAGVIVVGAPSAAQARDLAADLRDSVRFVMR
ncbi:ATP-grasp domain-containing protein [Dactylosporangium sp. CA-139114]|uniref:ATP-grasp domain-containing protein n=1 Tax=Dactylosporangium sp. CA-139114 TaxID=3239931 RepID=UPI003D96ADD3